MNKEHVDVLQFLQNGFDLKAHLSEYLNLSVEELDSLLPQGAKNLAALHPGGITFENPISFYENQVGSAHLLDLASWHLNSSEYIAETLRLQASFAKGHVLDFGGGIGTHALAAAALPEVDHVWFVDLNPQNRDFVAERAGKLGLSKCISVHRDLKSTQRISFDTLVCLDVLEHISDPAEQLRTFHKYLSTDSVALMNWYFYKGDNGEYPFHFDDPKLIQDFFHTLQSTFIEIFHPFLITTRAYRPIN